MKSILRAIFKPLPSPGEVFILDDDSNKDPFETKTRKVEVIETRKGWVRFKIVGSYYYQDLRLSRSSFHFCYRRDS